MPDEFTVFDATTSSPNQLYVTTQAAIKAMKACDLKFDVIPHEDEDEADRIVLVFNAPDSPSMRVLCVFPSAEDYAAILIHNIVFIPQHKTAMAYKITHDVQRHFIFARWLFDENDNSMQAEWFGPMEGDDTSGRLFVEALQRMVAIAHDGYSIIMDLLTGAPTK